MFNTEEEEDGLQLYANVILPLPLPGTFTYKISRNHTAHIKIGNRVLVPFGRGKLYTGVVKEIHQQHPGNFSINFIQEILDEAGPLILPKQIKLWEWIAQYYMAPIGEVMKVALPAGLNFHSLTLVELNPDIYWKDLELSENETLVLEVISSRKKCSVKKLEQEPALKTIAKKVLQLIRDLYRRDLIFLSEDIQQNYKPKIESRVSASPSFLSLPNRQEELTRLYKKAPKQYQALVTIMGQSNREISKSILEKEKGIPFSSVTGLIKKGWVTLKKVEVSRIQTHNREDPSVLPELTPYQIEAKTQIEKQWENHRVVLLQAPTGSGKTLIYIHLIAQALESQKQVLMLVPEIALTQQLAARLNEYFGNQMHIINSRYGVHNKTEIWHNVQKGISCLIVGPRSAALLPFSNLDLVIVDEEHESTFKQYDKMPRYQGKDLAIKQATEHGARVLCASATPSLESFYNSHIKKWGYVTYSQRYNLVNPAQIELISLSSSTKEQGIKSFMSKTLQEQIHATLEQGKQVLLFQNKKGYVPQLRCGQCEWTPKCISCDISLTYYKYAQELRCHYCGYKQNLIQVCEACKSTHIHLWGYGTERITEETKLKFPGIEVKRFDQDTARGQNSHQKLLQEFEEQKIKILVGTQLLVKGIDFGNVGLCSVVSADSILHLPDFRATERTFQLITQLAGRAGRRDGQGLLLVQTGQKEHPVYTYIRNYDYEGFAQYELEIRKKLLYPPYVRLIRIVIKHPKKGQVHAASEQFAAILRSRLGSRILGPEEPYISRIKNLYIRNILVKLNPQTDPLTAIKNWMWEQTKAYLAQEKRGALTISYDVDPN